MKDKSIYEGTFDDGITGKQASYVQDMGGLSGLMVKNMLGMCWMGISMVTVLRFIMVKKSMDIIKTGTALYE